MPGMIYGSPVISTCIYRERAREREKEREREHPPGFSDLRSCWYIYIYIYIFPKLASVNGALTVLVGKVALSYLTNRPPMSAPDVAVNMQS